MEIESKWSQKVYTKFIFVQFNGGTLLETVNTNYKLQVLAYFNTVGLHNFARHMNAQFYKGYILETTFQVALAAGDILELMGKIATTATNSSGGIGNFEISSGPNAMTSLMMIKIA